MKWPTLPARPFCRYFGPAVLNADNKLAPGFDPVTQSKTSLAASKETHGNNGNVATGPPFERKSLQQHQAHHRIAGVLDPIDGLAIFIWCANHRCADRIEYHQQGPVFG